MQGAHLFSMIDYKGFRSEMEYLGNIAEDENLILRVDRCT